MKKILFKSGSTMMGGLEKVQIEYINFLLEQEKYQVKIVIENDNGKDNALEKYINSKISKYFIASFSIFPLLVSTFFTLSI